MPVAISFTVETDGRLPSGQALGEAIEQVDDETDGGPAYYMINCAHPTHFEERARSGEPWQERIRGLRANASTKSHAELDEATELDEGDPADLGARYAALRARAARAQRARRLLRHRPPPPRSESTSRSRRTATSPDPTRARRTRSARAARACTTGSSPLKAFREPHGREGGEVNASNAVLEEALANVGAEIMGRGKFGGGPGPWGDDPWRGWWGEDPPFHMPVFVLTHHEREPLTLSDTTFTFVTDGIESALEQARAAAAGKDVTVGGGADAINQYLAAGLVDELELHIVPLVLGGGARLFEGVGPDLTLEQVRAVEAPGVTHLKYRVAPQA